MSEVSLNYINNLFINVPSEIPSWVMDVDMKKPKKIRSYSEITNPLQTDEHQTIVKVHITRKATENQQLSELLAHLSTR